MLQVLATRKLESRRLNKGFTLVEILVVLGVLALLMAILFPVFTRVRERGYRTTCLSNLKQVGLATQQYVQDNNGSYPGSKPNWTVGIFPYLKNDAAFNCPSEEHRDSAFKNGQLISGQFSDYTYNLVQFGDFNGGKWFGTHEAKHTPVDTSRLMMIVESGDPVESGIENAKFTEFIPLPCGERSRKDESYGFSILHSGGSNVAFADGHAKWLTPQAAATNYCDTEGTFPRPNRP